MTMPSPIFTRPSSFPKRFARLDGQIDVPLMKGTQITIVGNGSGGFALASLLASTGVGCFTLVDQDDFSEENLATTHITLGDVGRAKVEVTRWMIKHINPDADVTCHKAAFEDLPLPKQRKVFRDSNLIVQSTGSPHLALLTNGLALQEGCDAVHLATHSDNRSFEVMGTLGGDKRAPKGCVRCFSKARSDRFEANEITPVEGVPTSRLIAEMRNTIAAFAAVGLLHFRADSGLPIADWGAAFADHPCWIGDLSPAPGGVFGDLPAYFGVRPCREPLPKGWECPHCGMRGE